jgi:hypothetical protein
MGHNDYSGLLYSQPSYLEGFARVLDVGDTFGDYNYARSGAEADHLALVSDWYAVGADLYRAIGRFASRVGSKGFHGQDTGPR